MGTRNEVPRFPREHRLRRLKVFEEKADPAREGSLFSVRRGSFANTLSGEPGTGLGQFPLPL